MWRRRPLAARLLRHASTTTSSTFSLSSLHRLTADLAAAASAFVPSVDETAPEPWGAGAWHLYTRCERGGAPLLLRRRATGGGRESVVLDAGAVAAALGAAAVRSLALSPCGAAVALVVDGGGGDGDTQGAVVRASDQRVVARLPGATSVEFFGPDAASLLYVAADAAGRPARAVACDGLGRGARTVYEERDGGRSLFVGTSKDGVLATLTSAGPAAAAVRVLTAGSADPVLVSPARDGAETFVEHWEAGGGLVALTNVLPCDGDGDRGGHPADYALAALPSPGAPPSAWTLLIPRRPRRAIVDVDVFGGGVLVHERDTATGAPAASILTPARTLLPVTGLPDAPGTVLRGGTNADATARVARVLASSPLAPAAPFDVCLATARAAALPRPPPVRAAAAAAAAAASGLTTASVVVGDDVRVTVVEAAKTVAAAPPRPTLLSFYGAYGAPHDPDFHPVALALADRHGWRLAWAHGRGGGDRGRGWHAAGRGAARGAALADARAALAWAAAGGRAPVALAAESAGALLVGALLAALPATVAAVALRSPFLDVATADALTPGEAGEWAPPGACLTAVCPLALLTSPAAAAAVAAAPRGGPPVLIQTARGDARAPVAAVERWAAALRRLRESAHGVDAAPVVLDVREGGWHGAGGPGGEEGVQLDAAAAAYIVAAVGTS